MTIFLIMTIFVQSQLFHPDYENELHIIYSSLERDDGKKIGIGAGFLRGEFLSFSLGALLLGFVPLNEKPDYEVNPIWNGGYPLGNTAYIFGDKGFITIENGIISFTIETKNYSLKMKFSSESKCVFQFQSSGAEETIFIPYLRSEGKLRTAGMEISLKGFSSLWNLFGKNRFKLNDHATFCMEKECGFIEFDLRKKKAMVFICEGKKKEEGETDFSIKNFLNGVLTGKSYPSEIEIKKYGIKINVDSMRNEAKLLNLSYLISSISLEKDSKKGKGFIFFHPVEEKKKWEF